MCFYLLKNMLQYGNLYKSKSKDNVFKFYFAKSKSLELC